MRPRHVLCIAAVMAGLAACRIPFKTGANPQDDLSRAADITDMPGSLAANWFRTRTLVSPEPPVNPSVLFVALGQQPDGPAKQRVLVDALVRKTVAALNQEGMSAVAHATFGPEMGTALENIARANPGSPLSEVAIGQITDEVLRRLREDPTKLDRFPTIPLDKVREVQAELFRKGQPTVGPISPRAFTKADDGTWRNVVLRREGCERPAVQETRSMEGIELYDRTVPIGSGVVPCFHENSIQLATLLNRLANTKVGETVEAAVVVAGTAGEPKRVAGNADLLDALSAAGFTVELFQARGFVNFFSLTQKAPAGDSALRMVTWVKAHVAGKEVLIPGEHGEIDLLIRKDDNDREAWGMVRWFVGIPDAEFKGMTAYWRPYDFLRAGWEGWTVEHIEVLPSPRVRDALPWLDGAAQLMVGYQAVQLRFQPPFNSYGLFVCSDSLAMVIQRIGELRAGRSDADAGWVMPGGRRTGAFPLLRVRTFQAEGDVDELFGHYSGLDVARMAQLYLPDEELDRQAVPMQVRLREAFPKGGRAEARLDALKEFKEAGFAAIHAPMPGEEPQ